MVSTYQPITHAAAVPDGPAQHHLVFVDPVATRPYDERDLARGTLGGTEATVLRVARELARRHRVTVLQRTREEVRSAEGVRYAPYEHKSARPLASTVDHVVVVRATKVLKRIRRRHPDASLTLWLHCYPGRRRRWLGRRAWEARANVVTVSEHAADELRRFLQTHDPKIAWAVDVRSIHNPLAPDLPEPAEVDRDKLVFLSSPHKGLDQVYRLFRAAHRRWPSLRLHVANPGYLERDFEQPAGVRALGKLSHAEAMHELRDALCLFYPQTRFSETFGLVFAEANAVGVPVLAHPLGSAMEVVGCERQVVDCTDWRHVLETLERWRSGQRPQVAADPRFGIERVARRWESLLDAAPMPAARTA